MIRLFCPISCHKQIFNSVNDLAYVYCMCFWFSFQLHQINASVEALLKSLADAPHLKSIPEDVKEVKENVAKFGSKMTELESQLTGLQASVGQIKTEVQKNSKVRRKFHIILQT